MPLRQVFPSVDSPTKNTKIDIIAVHGLNPRSKADADHAWDTWRTPPGPQGRLWLRDDLPRFVPNARIFLYQYNATAVYGKDRDTFVGKANELLEAIRVERDDFDDVGGDGAGEGGSDAGSGGGSGELRPIIFLCHSMGGLLVKQALINAHNNPKYTPIKTATSGLAFFATPHNGGDWKLVSLGSVASKIATAIGFQQGDDVLEVLKSGSIFSDILQEHWRHQLLQYDIVSFWGAFDNVVPRESARLGMPGDRENVVKLEADHSGVCKFGLSETDQDNLKLVRGNIKDLARSALKTGGPRRSSSDRDRRPRYYLVPSLRRKNFTGRSAILEDLQQRLFVRRECQKLAIVGLGGVGKTQVALQFAHWVKENQPEYSIFWVPALSIASFAQAYVEIGKSVGAVANPDEDSKESLRRHLSSEDAGRWLLIVDNADDMDVLFGSAGIYQYLPDSEAGMTLFTTRTMEVATAVAMDSVIELHEMDPREAEAFLRKSLVRKHLLHDESVTAELLRELTYLPLAITQAVAYLNRNSQVSIRRYLELLRGTEQDMVSLMSREFQDNTRYQGSQNAVATTWLVSFEQIQKSDRPAAELLAFISCIEPKAIPRSLLPTTGSQEELEFAIGTLSAFAFLAGRGDDNDDVYDMHSLVHLATRIWVQQRGWAENVTVRAVKHLRFIFPRSDTADRRVWQPYLPHAFRLLEGSSMYQLEDCFILAYRVGDCLRADWRCKEAVRCLEGVSEWSKEHYAATDEPRLVFEYGLASAYLGNGQGKDAIRILEPMVEFRKRTCGDEDHARLTTEQALASAYAQERRTIDAIAILERVAEVLKRTRGEEDYSRLATEQALAAAYSHDGRTTDAIEILEHVVEVERRLFDEEDLCRLASERTLATVYLDDERAADAIAVLEHVVEVQKRIFREDDYHRLSAEYALGRAYLMDERAEDAIRILEYVVEVKRRILDEEDPSRLAFEYTLAEAYLDDGRAHNAIRMLEHVVKIQERILREEDYDRLSSECALGDAYLMVGRAEDAVRVLEHVVRVHERVLGEEDRKRLASKLELARAYLLADDGRVEDAIQMLEQVVAAQVVTLPEGDAELLWSRKILEQAYEKRDRKTSIG